MNGLNKLLAAQKAKREGVTGEVQPTAVEPVRVQDSAESQTTGDSHSDSAGSIPDGSPTDTPAQGSGTPPSGGVLGRLRLLNATGNPGSRREDDSGTQATPSGGGVSDSPSVRDAGNNDGAGISLDDLAGMDESAAPAIEQTTHSGYFDEIEATAPDRDLPADLESQQLLFVEQLDSMYQVLNDPELFGQSVRIIMSEMQENPEYEKLISDQDVHTMIRAMRNTMGLARIKKQEKKRKAAGTGAKGPKKAAVGEHEMALLDSLGIGDDD